MGHGEDYRQPIAANSRIDLYSIARDGVREVQLSQNAKSGRKSPRLVEKPSGKETFVAESGANAVDGAGEGSVALRFVGRRVASFEEGELRGACVDGK
jgi:hypothetical protein